MTIAPETDRLQTYRVENGLIPPGGVTSVRALDSYVPIGPAADLVLVGEDDVLRALVG
jgi:hypothetical protein